MLNAKLIRKFIERMSPMHADGSWQIPEMALAAAVIEQSYTDLRDAFANGEDPNHEFERQRLSPWMHVLGIEPIRFHETILNAFSSESELCRGYRQKRRAA